MSRWFEINADALQDYRIARLTHAQFRRTLEAAKLGEQNEWAPYIRGPYSRPHAHEWREIRARIFKRDDYTCRYCGERGGRLECDHIHPVAKGGSSEDDNLATACFTCNRSKRSKTVDEWRR